ncbi:hypothetical protein C5Y96_23470 [Blastopirellula marina]|uniref:Uncharacterized protein n=1 Tax=Blastopirellula marina TaxID=124 RepID=A0A2S8F0S1_9BACT|nr:MULTISPECIES: hypothetical protein [Pirellulaceae]PQO25772.1 hypothetical protein C5Y96_23470 [Blastopirellula marina]RCS43455.1 hypothetical protein DTL36_23520 [Bremerella cremea]
MLTGNDKVQDVLVRPEMKEVAMEPFGSTMIEPAEDHGSDWGTPERKPVNVILVIGTILACWALAMFGPLSIFFPLLAIGVILHLLSKRQLLAAFSIVAFSPFMLAVFIATVSYATGTATLQGMGYPGNGYFNVDPTSRCLRSNGGCCVSGNEWVFILPNNMTVTALSVTLGPMAGSYRGSYPTEAEAKQAIQTGNEVAEKDLRAGFFAIDGYNVKLDEGVGSRLLERLHYDFIYKEPKPPITAAIYDQDCFILRIPVAQNWDTKNPSAAIALISSEKGRPFAFYAEGDYHQPFPPVTWNRSPDE